MYSHTLLAPFLDKSYSDCSKSALEDICLEQSTIYYKILSLRKEIIHRWNDLSPVGLHFFESVSYTITCALKPILISSRSIL